ncbi:hypothetical protein R1sor_027237 [Riccia sorocarpa]|uniref:Uncharacterized protein n=1 Tax=Riccia sorocarpa TaxID=122646 RepID=A0ABD3GHV4_9MARC
MTRPSDIGRSDPSRDLSHVSSDTVGEFDESSGPVTRSRFRPLRHIDTPVQTPSSQPGHPHTPMAPHPSPVTQESTPSILTGGMHGAGGSQDPLMSHLSDMFTAAGSTQLAFTQEQLAAFIATYVPLAVIRTSAFATVSIPPVTMSVPSATMSVPSVTMSVPSATVSVPPVIMSVPSATVSVPPVTSPVPPATMPVPLARPVTAPVHPSIAHVRPATVPISPTIPVPARQSPHRASSASQSYGRDRRRSCEPEVAPRSGRRSRNHRHAPDITPAIVVSGIGRPKLLSRKCLLFAVRKVCGMRVLDHRIKSDLSEEESYRIKQEIRGRFSNGGTISELEIDKMMTKYLGNHKNHYIDMLKHRLAALDHVSFPDAELTIPRPVHLREESFAPLLHTARQIFWFAEIDRMEHELAAARSAEDAGDEPARPSAYYLRGLQIARGKSNLYGLPAEKYSLAAERVEARITAGHRATHFWGQGGLFGFQCRFFERFRREVSAAETQYALDYDEDRLFQFLIGGGTFHDAQPDRANDAPPPPAGPDGAGPSRHWHSQEGGSGVDSNDRLIINTVLGRVPSSQVLDEPGHVREEEDPAPRVRDERARDDRSANSSQHPGRHV